MNDEYKSDSNFAILGLDQWNGNNSAVQGFKDATNVTFPLLKNASSVASDYGTTYDRLIVIDTAGKIHHKGSKNVSSDLDGVVTKVKNLLDNIE